MELESQVEKVTLKVRRIGDVKDDIVETRRKQDVLRDAKKIMAHERRRQ